jgi:hypothetical protein
MMIEMMTTMKNVIFHVRSPDKCSDSMSMFSCYINIIQHLELLEFRTLSIIRYSRN